MMDRDEFLQLQEGDEFIVSEDAEVESDHENEVGYYAGWNTLMESFIGKILSVSRVDSESEYIVSKGYFFTRGMVEPAQKQLDFNIQLDSVFA